MLISLSPRNVGVSGFELPILPAPLRSRSNDFFSTPAHRSTPAHAVFRPLRSVSAPLTLRSHALVTGS